MTLENLWLLFSSFFVLGASCYLLFITSDPLEEIGGKIGRLLRLPEDVIASTFQAMATSGPEIVMAIVAATPFITGDVWQALEMGEKACSGTLNMAFSAMDNLLGIGAVAMIFLIILKKVNPDDKIPVKPSTIIGLVFYIFASGYFALSIKNGILTFSESWTLMGIGIAFVLSQFFIPAIIAAKFPEEEEDEDEDTEPVPAITSEPIEWSKEMILSGMIYAFLVFALVIFVQKCMGATFNMALTGWFSVGGVLIMFTSYVSSFPEFMMSYRYVIADKKAELLGMLFGSNVIDLAFAGFRSIWLHEDMAVYTTGRFPELLPFYIWTLPVLAILLLIGLKTQVLKWKHSYGLVVFYVCYIVSGFVLL